MNTMYQAIKVHSLYECRFYQLIPVTAMPGTNHHAFVKVLLQELHPMILMHMIYTNGFSPKLRWKMSLTSNIELWIIIQCYQHLS